MPKISQNRLTEYQLETFRFKPERRLHNADEAVAFVDERGFTFFWPITGIRLPSLWGAVAGDRPVADAHDDPGHVTWGWKDELLGQRRWYYAKVLRKRGTMISLEYAPYFYALSENYGSPEEDYLTLYEQGRLTQEARQIYETLLQEGPMHTVALRKAARMTSRESDGRFNKAMADLQADFKIMPVGVAHAGAWNYAFIYEITAHHHPELIEHAQQIGENQARQVLAGLYFRSVGAATRNDLQRLLGWRPAQTDRSLTALVNEGFLVSSIEVESMHGEVFALPELV